MTKTEAIDKLQDLSNEVYNEDSDGYSYAQAIDLAIESLSAETEWITDRKPTEDGTYMVTLDAFGHHRYIDLMHYGKPLMPNRKVKGKCWYMDDDEWGDVIYDDEDILAWMPLPTPYKGGDTE